MSKDYFDGLCTVTLQGGGVLGLSLLGQLKAVDEEEARADGPLRPVAYAGASAGGFLAALRWAGFTAEEIEGRLRRIVDDPEAKRRMLTSGLPAYTFSGPRPPWSARPETMAREKRRFSRLIAQRASVARLGVLGILRCIANAGTIFGAFRHGGLFGAQGLTAELDGWFREALRRDLAAAFEAAAEDPTGQDTARLREVMDEIGLPPPGSPEFDAHRPRFVDFDVARHTVQTGKTHPALVLSVTDVDRRETLFLDSYRAAFEHIALADAVRATISFPLFFQPVTLAIPRDELRAGGLPTRESLRRHRATHLAEETCVDGGVLANFPLWALDSYLRQTLYGHTGSGGQDMVRLGDSPGSSQGPIRERFVFDPATRQLSPPSQPPDGDDAVFRPLALLAYRPMLHVGLTFAPQPQERARPFLLKLFGVVATGARTAFESRASRSGSRILLIEQGERAEDTGWSHSILDFGPLDGPALDVMVRKGYAFARARLDAERAERRLPRPWERFRIARRGPALSLEQVLAETARDAHAFAAARLKDGFDGAGGLVAVASAHVLHGTGFAQLDRVAAPGDGRVPEERIEFGDITDDDGAGFLARCYFQRCAFALSASASRRFQEDTSALLRFALPLVDRSEIRRGEFGTRIVPPRPVCDPANGEAIPEFLQFSARRDVVVSGALLVDLHAGQEADPAAASQVWAHLFEREGSEIRFLLHVLAAHAETVSGLLTDAYARPEPGGSDAADLPAEGFRWRAAPPRESSALRRFWAPPRGSA